MGMDLGELNFHMENGPQEAQNLPNRYNHMSRSQGNLSEFFSFTIVVVIYRSPSPLSQTLRYLLDLSPSSNLYSWQLILTEMFCRDFLFLLCEFDFFYASFIAAPYENLGKPAPQKKVLWCLRKLALVHFMVLGSLGSQHYQYQLGSHCFKIPADIDGVGSQGDQMAEGANGSPINREPMEPIELWSPVTLATFGENA